MNTSPLVSPQGAKAMMEDNSKTTFFFDATWLLNPPPERNTLKEFQEVGRLPNSNFFDLAACMSSAPKPLAQMLPSAQYFDYFVRALTNNPSMDKETSNFVLYDTVGLFSSPRAWWLFKTFGFKNVWVLNGGFGNWVNHGYPVERGEWKNAFNKPSNELMEMNMKFVGAENNTYPVPNHPKNVKTYQDMKSLTRRFEQSLTAGNKTTFGDGGKKPLVLDARPAARFYGQGVERSNLPVGHIPYSANLFFADLLEVKTLEEGYVSMYNLPYKTFTTMPTSPETLMKLFKQKTQNMEETQTDIQTFGKEDNLVFTCGSGVTASALNLAFSQMGWEWEKMSLYDGSWTEWAAYESGVVGQD